MLHCCAFPLKSPCNSQNPGVTLIRSCAQFGPCAVIRVGGLPDQAPTLETRCGRLMGWGVNHSQQSMQVPFSPIGAPTDSVPTANVDYESSRSENFYDISVVVTGYRTLEEALAGSEGASAGDRSLSLLSASQSWNLCMQILDLRKTTTFRDVHHVSCWSKHTFVLRWQFYVATFL